MHIKTRLIGLLAVVAILPMAALAQEAIHWEPTLENAQNAAGQSNRLVLIEFWAPWCGVCKRMEAEVLSQPSLAAVVATNYAAVKVNADHFPETARRYGVSALPTMVITTPQGKVLDTIKGRVEVAELSARLNQVAAMAKQSGGSVYAQLPSSTNPPATASPTTQAMPAVNQPVIGAQNLQPLVGAQNLPPLGNNQPSNMAGGPSLGPAASPPVANAAMNTSVPTVNRYADYYRGGQTGGMAPIAQPQTGVAASSPSQPPTMNYQPSAQPPVMGAYGARPPVETQPSANLPANNPNVPSLASRAPVQMPAINSPLGLEGFCPVALAEKQQWVPGDRRWGGVHRGRTYLFSGPEEQRKFFADPDRYAPAVSGNDVVLAAEQGQVVPGSREHGVFFGTRVYLFSSEANLEKFSRNPNQYANQALGALRTGAYAGQPL